MTSSRHTPPSMGGRHFFCTLAVFLLASLATLDTSVSTGGEAFARPIHILPPGSNAAEDGASMPPAAAAETQAATEKEQRLTVSTFALPASEPNGGGEGVAPGSPLLSSCMGGNGPVCLALSGGCVTASVENFCQACEIVRHRVSWEDAPASCSKKAGYRALEAAYERPHGGTCTGLGVGSCHCDATGSVGAECRPIDDYRAPHVREAGDGEDHPQSPKGKSLKNRNQNGREQGKPWVDREANRPSGYDGYGNPPPPPPPPPNLNEVDSDGNASVAGDMPEGPVVPPPPPPIQKRQQAMIQQQLEQQRLRDIQLQQQNARAESELTQQTESMPVDPLQSLAPEPLQSLDPEQPTVPPLQPPPP